ncbi:hypothetical protein ES705_46639 [subsurface metagenome]
MSGYDRVIDSMFGKSIFKSESTLFPEFVPPELPTRDKEITRLAKNFRSLLGKEGSFSVNVAKVFICIYINLILLRFNLS